MVKTVSGSGRAQSMRESAFDFVRVIVINAQRNEGIASLYGIVGRRTLFAGEDLHFQGTRTLRPSQEYPVAEPIHIFI
jgi:hypothetical protein